MKFFAISTFLLLILGFASAEEQEHEVCSDEFEERCAAFLNTTDYDIDRHLEYCRDARKSLPCLNEIAEQCFEEDGEEGDDDSEYTELVTLIDTIKALCGSKEGETEELGCLRSKAHLEQEVISCGNSLLPSLLSVMFDETLTDDDKFCIAFDNIVECMRTSMSESCGPYIGGMIADAMKEAIKESKSFSEDSTRCHEMFGGQRKKRSVRMNFSALSRFGI